MSTEADCPFCQIAAGTAPAKMVEQGDFHVAFEPLRPHVPGHVLFVPREHVADVTDRPLVAMVAMLKAANYVRDVIRGPANIITSVGAEATQTVFHAHIHVIPRGSSDGLRKSWPWRLKKGEELTFAERATQ